MRQAFEEKVTLALTKVLAPHSSHFASLSVKASKQMDFAAIAVQLKKLNLAAIEQCALDLELTLVVGTFPNNRIISA